MSAGGFEHHHTACGQYRTAGKGRYRCEWNEALRQIENHQSGETACARTPTTPHTRLYPALAWFYHTEYGGEAIRVARLLQPINEGGIIGMAEICVAELLQSRRYLARQLLFSSLNSQGLLVLLTLVLVGYYAGSCGLCANFRH